MATVKFRIITKKIGGKRQNKVLSPLQVRFSDGRKLQPVMNIPIKVFGMDWSSKTQTTKSSKNGLTGVEANDINRKLVELKQFIEADVRRINLEASGEVTDKDWLRSLINEFFNKTDYTNVDDYGNRSVFVTDYMDYWLEERMPVYKARGKNGRLSHQSQLQYKSFVNQIKRFEIDMGLRIEFRRLDSIFQGKFVLYMLEDREYDNTSIKNYLGKFLFFVKQAKKESIKVHSNFPDVDVFSVAPSDARRYITFNVADVDLMTRFDLSHDEELEAVRDWFVIGINTGMAFSDLRDLDLNKHLLNDGRIQKTRIKTQTPFVIPKFFQVDRIFKRWEGLPPMHRTSSKHNDNQKYNRQLQELCKIMGFTEMTDFPVWHYSRKEGKKVYSRAYKWEAVTSHCARRSFATIMSEKDEEGNQMMDNGQIMTVGGWKDLKMVDNYNQMTIADKAVGAETKINKRQRELAERKLVVTPTIKIEEEEIKVITLNPIRDNNINEAR